MSVVLKQTARCGGSWQVLAATAAPCDAGPLDGEAAARHPGDMLIYKIFRAPEWQALERDGHTLGAPIDLTDGYIHFSTAAQAAETAAKHFAGVEGLWLAAVEVAALGDDLKWEVSRGGAEFPHLYRSLQRTDVLWCVPLPLVDGEHVFPDPAS